MKNSHTFPGHSDWLEDLTPSPVQWRPRSQAWPSPGLLWFLLYPLNERHSNHGRDGRKEGWTSLTGAGELACWAQTYWGWRSLEKRLHLLAESFTAGRGETDHWVPENEILGSTCNHLKVDISAWPEVSPGVGGKNMPIFKSFPWPLRQADDCWNVGNER